MSRIYWDTMLFVYLFENHPTFGARVAHIYQRMVERGDELYTSSLTLGELLVAPYKLSSLESAGKLESFFAGPDVNLLPFTAEAARHFARIRASHKMGPADAIHLACAADAKVDLFISNDSRLVGKFVPGIQFVVGLNTDLL